MKFLTVLAFLSISVLSYSQGAPQSSVSKDYRAAADKVNDLVHTKMDARFDYDKSYMYGKAWITLKPHFYPTDSVKLDAKGMDIKEVAIVKGTTKGGKLNYTYDGFFLNIKLDRTYKGSEPYTVYIDYTAKPNEFKTQGSAAITDAKGLYFINPKGEEKNKPTQIWTQGETEANSVWIPTIDKPNQKTTNEFSLTVPAKYVTLSNGKLASQKKNADGTRTDTWKMEQSHSPYLFFMGIGDFAVVKDKYKDKEVSYYVEHEYAPVARKIFGNTPDMMRVFSNLLGVDYPWVKYSQMVGRDYVSGAMENTTATLHGEGAQQDARELTDRNRQEGTIAHELFHQWFGDYVTAESWSNITLNESFATIGSQLWNEFGHSKDAAYEERLSSLQGYLNSRSEAKELVRFHYNDKEDVFDAVSYNKGGAVLQMLRNYVGDSAFFKALNLYLTTNKYKSAEAHQLRLAFEEVSGKDLNWFWNQWYFNSGHPRLNVNHTYNPATKQVQLIVEQTQGDKVYTMPVKVDVWTGNTPTTQTIWIKNKIDTFNFASASKPSLVNFDADKVLVATKRNNKSLEELLFQYRNARNYVDRREAIDSASKRQSEVLAVEIFREAVKDKYAPLRAYAISQLDMKKEAIKSALEGTLLTTAQTEKDKLTKAAAITKLGDLKSAQYTSLFRSAINDSSYSVAGSALEALGKVDSTTALSEAKRLSSTTTKGRLKTSINRSILLYSDESSATDILTNFEAAPLTNAKLQQIEDLSRYLSRVQNATTFKRGVDAIAILKDQSGENRTFVAPFVDRTLASMQKIKTDAGQTEMADYIGSKLEKKKL